MNLTDINTFRAAQGLAPIVRSAADVARDAQKKRQRAANHAARAQANRDVKAARGTRGKK